LGGSTQFAEPWADSMLPPVIDTTSGAGDGGELGWVGDGQHTAAQDFKLVGAMYAPAETGHYEAFDCSGETMFADFGGCTGGSAPQVSAFVALSSLGLVTDRPFFAPLISLLSWLRPFGNTDGSFVTAAVCLAALAAFLAAVLRRRYNAFLDGTCFC
jgi:hypothetical protein